MVKLVFLCRRRPDISHARYVERVLEGHVPLALRHHQTMRGYVVNPVESVPEGLPVIDSVAELWFDSLADYRERLYDSEAGRAAIAADVRRFMGGAKGYVTTEHVHKAAAAPRATGVRSAGVKLFCPVRRRPDLDHRTFVDHWLGRHVPLALRHHPGLCRYVTNVVEAPLSEGAEPWDGFAELHFPSAGALAAGMFDSPEGERVVRADVARFIGHTGAYVVAEHPQRLATNGPASQPR
jgi:uncharacterized protein (TIGR02118 family)